MWIVASIQCRRSSGGERSLAFTDKASNHTSNRNDMTTTMIPVLFILLLLNVALAHDVKPLYNNKHFRGYNQSIHAEYALVQGQVYRNDIDNRREGMDNVLVQLVPLQTAAHHLAEHAVETDASGDFIFNLDAIDLMDTNEFWLQVVPPEGYRSVGAENGGTSIHNKDDAITHKSFRVELGQTYSINTELVSLCDASLYEISFSGISHAASKEDGQIQVEWEMATIESLENVVPDMTSPCHQDLVVYHVFAALSSFDFGSYSVKELMHHALVSDDVIHVETGDVDVMIDGLELGITCTVLVVARAGGVYSQQFELRNVVVSGQAKASDKIAGKQTVAKEMTQSQRLLTRQRRTQESTLPLINEIIYLPDPRSTDLNKRRKFVEIYRPDTVFSLRGCVLESDSGSFRVVFDENVGSATYFVVKHKATLDRDQVLWKSRGILWLREFEMNEIDGVALTCRNEMLDFVAWGVDGVGPNGDLYNEAADISQWSSNEDFVETGTPAGLLDQVGSGLFVDQSLQPGDSIGRDGASIDTNGPVDWSFSGGTNARGPTPSAKNFQHFALPVINEVLYLDVPDSSDLGKRRMFVEIYRADTSYSLVGCSLINSNGAFRVEMDESFEDVDDEYFVIKHKATLSSEFRLARKFGILWYRDFELSVRDGISIFCDDKMVDYVGWGDTFGPLGYLPDAAVNSGIWPSTEDFVETGRQALGGTYISPGIKNGDSLARDLNSTDVNNSTDWIVPGGLNARVPTPSERNLRHSHLPLINEVLYNPRPGSSDFSKRRVFIEIYRQDTSFSLTGCSLVNHDGSFRTDFGGAFDDIDATYFQVKQKSTLSRPFSLWKSRGILWLRDMALDDVDAVALMCDNNMVDYVSWGIDGLGWTGLLHENAVETGMWTGLDDHVETADFRRGDSLGRDAESTDTNSVPDWIHQGGPNANGATPGSRNTSPLLILDSELQIYDLTIGLESIGDYLEPSDSGTASLSICNTKTEPIFDVEVWLQTDVAGLTVPDDPVPIISLAEETCTCIQFPISTSNTSPGLHPIDVTLVTPDDDIFSEAQVLVLETSFDVELETLFVQGRLSMNIECSDGNYDFTVEYNPRDIQRFDATSIAPLIPLQEFVTFTPVRAFRGTHPPEAANVLSTAWKKKLLFGVANFFALEVVFLKTLLGTVSERGLDGILNLLKAKGWKYTFTVVSKLLGRYHGMLGINLSLGSSIISAYAADPPEGDIFYVGELNTDPGSGLTVEERVEVYYQDVDYRFDGPTRVVGRRVFTRVLSDGSELIYAEDFDVVGDDSIAVDSTTNQLSYDVGDFVRIEAEAVHGREGALSGCHGVITAGIYPETATAASITALLDDGVGVDRIAGDGIFTGQIEITEEVVCSGGNSLPVLVLAQHTYHELDTGEVPNFSIGFEELRISVEGATAPDLVAFVYDLPTEMRIGSNSRLEIEVRNIGESSTPRGETITVEAWMSKNDSIGGSDVLIGRVTVANRLLPGISQRFELSFNVPSLDGPGDYFILIRTDPNNDIMECNQDNNLIPTGFTLLP